MTLTILILSSVNTALLLLYGLIAASVGAKISNAIAKAKPIIDKINQAITVAAVQHGMKQQAANQAQPVTTNPQGGNGGTA